MLKEKKTIKTKTKSGIEIEHLGDIELSPELDEKVKQMTAEADAEDSACRVNFRWEKSPLELVKKAAAIMGVPYQIYIKQVLYRQATADIQQAQSLNSK